jgi:hypothetical protein
VGASAAAASVDSGAGAGSTGAFRSAAACRRMLPVNSVIVFIVLPLRKMSART